MDVYQLAIDEREALRKRLVEVEDFIRQYDQFAKTVKPAGTQFTQAPASGLVKATIKQTIAEAMDILKDGRHWPSRKLLEQIRSRGYDIGGGTEQAKLLNLSNALSREGKNNGTVKADRKLGWSLKVPKVKSPTSAVTLAGLGSRGVSTLSAKEPNTQD